MTQEEFFALRQDVALLRAYDHHRREYVDGRLEAASRAVDIAAASVDKRLNQMNEMRGSLDDLTKQMMTRTETLAVVKAVEQTLGGEVNELRSKSEARDRPNYLLGFTALSAALVMITGFWTVMGLKVDSSISPLIVSIEQIKIGQIAQDRDLLGVKAKQDALALERRTDVHALQDATIKLQAELSHLTK